MSLSKCMPRKAMIPLKLSILFVLAVALPFPARATDAADDGKIFELQLLTFNDFHGHLQPPAGNDAALGTQLDPAGNLVGGAEYLATTLAQLRRGRPHSLTATAGDLIGGSPFLSAAFHDEPSVESLNALGLDVSGVGNHEFDEGRDELLRMQNGGCHPVDGCYFPDEPYKGAKFPWLAANVVDTGTGQTLLPGTWIKKVAGVEVGFIGMTLEGTNLLVAQPGIQGLEFRDEVETANEAARRLTRQGVRAIIVLIHEGGMQSGSFGECSGISGPIVDIALNLDPEIDLVVSGHTHLPYICNIPDPSGQPRLVTSASSFGRVVTETILALDRSTGQVKRDETHATNHLVVRTVPRDPEQTEIIEKWQTLAGPFQRRVIGSITGDISGSAGGNRGAESALANLITDTLLEATDDPAEGGAQIALINIGGVRTDLDFEQISGGEQPGEVTYSEAFSVQPFGNLNTVMDLTGAQIQRLLEQQFRSDRSRQQLFFGISRGFSFSWVASAPEGSKVPDDSVTLNGQPLDPDASYRVTVNNFLAAGGDGFDVLLEGTNRQGGGGDLEAFLAYFAVHSPVSSPGTDRILELP